MKKLINKKRLFILIPILFLIPATSYAVTATLEDPLGNQDKAGTEVIRDIITNVVKWIRAISLGLAVLMVVISGAIYLTSAGSERKSTASKMLTGVSIGLLVIFTAASLIIEALQSIGAPTGDATTELSEINEGQTFSKIMGNVAQTLGLLISFIGVLAIMVGGIVYMTAAGNEQRMELGKNILKYAIYGIGIALLSWSIVSFIESIVT